MDNLREIESHEIQESKSHQWYVMAPIYYQESTIKSYLDKKGIRCYLPTKTGVKTLDGRKQIVKIPVINSLLFVYTSESELKDICTVQPYLYYKYDKTNGVSRKMVVPTKQMNDFIKVYDATDSDKMMFFAPNDPALKAGKNVRIHKYGDVLDGVEGQLVTVAGKRKRQLSVTIGNLTSLVTDINPDLLEIME